MSAEPSAQPAPVAAQQGRCPSVAAALALALLLIAAYFIPRGPQSNPDSHLALTYALVEGHSVRIDGFTRLSGKNVDLLDKAAYCGPATVTATCRHYYSDKAPGMSLLAAAGYELLRPALSPDLLPRGPGADRFLLRFLLTLLAVSLPCALFLAAYWRFIAGFVGRGGALLVACGYGFGSMALPFSTLLFSHAVTAALVFSAFMLLFRAQRRERSGRLPALAGLLAGYAVCCEYPAALIAGLLSVYAVWGSTRVRAATVLRYGAGLLAGLLPLFLYNSVAFGSPLALGYGHLTDQHYAAGMAHGIQGVGLPTWEAIWGSTFSPYRGLFFLSPWLLLAFPGLRGMARAGWRREAWLCGAVCGSYFVFEWGYAFWDGGASVGPRHFLPALPFLAFPVAFALRERRVRLPATALVALSSAAMLLVIATDPLFGDPYYVRHVGFPLADQTLHDLWTGTLQNNWGLVLHLPGLLSLAPLLFGLWRLGRRISRGLRCAS